MSGNNTLSDSFEVLNLALAHENIINYYLDQFEQKTKIKKQYIVQGKMHKILH